MTGEKYINLAKGHFSTKDEEHIRCAISRYYYGLLHFSIDKLIELNSSEYDYLKITLESPHEGKSIHSSAINAVKDINPVLSGDLDIVRKLRVLSDYNFNESVLDIVTVKKDTKPVKSIQFNNENEILAFLNEVFLKVSSLKGSPKNGSPKFATHMPSILNDIKKRMQVPK